MDSSQTVIKRMNWSMIAREIKKLGINLDKELKELTLYPTHPRLHQIFTYLIDFERGGGCERLQ